jgi:hypothetical protein
MPLVSVIDPFGPIVLDDRERAPEADCKAIACRSKIEVSRGGKHCAASIARCDREMIEGLADRRYCPSFPAGARRPHQRLPHGWTRSLLPPSSCESAVAANHARSAPDHDCTLPIERRHGIGHRPFLEKSRQ